MRARVSRGMRSRAAGASLRDILVSGSSVPPLVSWATANTEFSSDDVRRLHNPSSLKRSSCAETTKNRSGIRGQRAARPPEQDAYRRRRVAFLAPARNERREPPETCNRHDKPVVVSSQHLARVRRQDRPGISFGLRPLPSTRARRSRCQPIQPPDRPRRRRR